LNIDFKPGREGAWRCKNAGDLRAILLLMEKIAGRRRAGAGSGGRANRKTDVGKISPTIETRWTDRRRGTAADIGVGAAGLSPYFSSQPISHVSRFTLFISLVGQVIL